MGMLPVLGSSSQDGVWEEKKYGYFLLEQELTP